MTSWRQPWDTSPMTAPKRAADNNREEHKEGRSPVCHFRGIDIPENIPQKKSPPLEDFSFGTAVIC
jgi:hypothetical protein